MAMVDVVGSCLYWWTNSPSWFS